MSQENDTCPLQVYLHLHQIQHLLIMTSDK